MGNVCGILAILMWSTLIGMTRSVIEDFGVAGGTALIYTIGAVSACLAQGGFPKINNIPRTYLFLCGSLFVGYEILLSQSIGLSVNNSQVLEVGMINYLWPCIIVVLSKWINHEKFNWLVYPGIILSVIGIFVCISSSVENLTINNFIINIKAYPIPYIFSLLAALSWGLYSNFSKKYSDDYNAISIFFTFIAILLWIRFYANNHSLPHTSFFPIINLGLTGLVFGVSYYLWEVGIHRGNLFLLAIVSLFIPLLSMLFACFRLGILPSYVFWMGTCLVVSGSVLSWTSKINK